MTAPQLALELKTWTVALLNGSVITVWAHNSGRDAYRIVFAALMAGTLAWLQPIGSLPSEIVASVIGG